ncbi:MAG: hypothetical protein IKP49_01270, partial [Treponema sp.]|nr:hypothetical protein [Treponema sp.]
EEINVSPELLFLTTEDSSSPSKIDITHEASIITSIALLYNYIFHSVKRKKNPPPTDLRTGETSNYFHADLRRRGAFIADYSAGSIMIA